MPDSAADEPDDAPVAEDSSVATAEAAVSTNGDAPAEADDEAAPAGQGVTPVELPQRFEVGFGLGRFDGAGTLTIDAGCITLFPDESLQAQGGFGPLQHEGSTVRVYAARWLPPTSNTGLLLEDGDQVALVDLPGWSRKRLRASLAAAGFELDQTITSLRLGRRLVRPTKRWWD